MKPHPTTTNQAAQAAGPSSPVPSGGTPPPAPSCAALFWSVKRDDGEWAKALAGMAAGALFLAYVEFLVLAHFNFFIVDKTVAAERRALDETYTRIAIGGNEE